MKGRGFTTAATVIAQYPRPGLFAINVNWCLPVLPDFYQIAGDKRRLLREAKDKETKQRKAKNVKKK